VDVNTASAPLLTRVSGIGAGLAENIVMHRDANGPFRNRSHIKKVARLGPKAFEQCAGFLRIPDGDDPLDASSVHPESYPVVRRILSTAGTDLRTLIGNTSLLRGLQPTLFVTDTVGLPTVTDIIRELEKPGRDPRPAFTTARFADGVEKIADLEAGMILEGVVTNVAAFGAFVDIGVHQDGLVHVSALSNTFVKDPRDVVKSGDVVKVRVVDVDEARKRISLTMRLEDKPDQRGPRREQPERGPHREQPERGQRTRQDGGGGQSRQNGGSGQRRQGGTSQGNQRQGSGQRGGGDRGGQTSSGGSFNGGAMADALRRAGLTKD
jgi:uncharacterized protein